ncbi:MAG: hypothetical protein JJ866_15820 [Roseibium sp.]|uniref:hypothetical protein n=1 Tax=Roseibium sp. TaxID=1936156 RepID=UPI001B15ED4E|nr:hypothetical protein [Roseibium sp.]MBO6893411.1 hypothetical protein [Roseibium sp.]MBO6930622.1 hypothetical protein [Roseibium sp.]
MIKVTDKQDVVVYAAVNLLTAHLPTELVIRVLADVMAEAIHDNAADPENARIAADTLNFRIKQRLQELAGKADG